MTATHPTVEPGRELVLVLLKEDHSRADRASVSSMLRRLDTTIEVDFGRGWLTRASRDVKQVIAAHHAVKVAGGVYQRTDRVLPRRTRRLSSQ